MAIEAGDDTLRIRRAETEADFRQVQGLMAEYIAWDARETTALGLDARTFLDFYYGSGTEVLPGAFAPPHGCLLLASVSAISAGCGGIRRIGPATCELKRMYVRPEFRGLRIGRRLAEELIAAARVAGYATMRLETTVFMEGARRLYESLGFAPCEPYYEIPESLRPITIFMQRNVGGKTE